jgi:hypothetical protein
VVVGAVLLDQRVRHAVELGDQDHERLASTSGS